jgi:hypothetical protein
MSLSADIAADFCDVRFTPESGHYRARPAGDSRLSRIFYVAHQETVVAGKRSRKPRNKTASASSDVREIPASRGSGRSKVSLKRPL